MSASERPKVFDLAVGLARRGRLYPSVILYGADDAGRRQAAESLARTLLCAAPAAERPCGECLHCRRITLGGDKDAPFHPDLTVLERDLKTSTSVEATKTALRIVQVSPFEARGQVLVVASADTLSDAAANALLKTLEEPHQRAPRHFLLLAPAAAQLLPTLRSRSLVLYLGGGIALAAQRADAQAALEALGPALDALTHSGPSALAIGLAGLLFDHVGAAAFEDPRAEMPWVRAASLLVALARQRPAEAGYQRALRQRLLALAQDLLDAPEMRLRAVPPRRIIEGLASRHLALMGGSAVG